MNHSKKIRIGIAMARAAGTQWGTHGAVLAKKNKDNSQEFAESLRPVILDLMLNAKSVKHRGSTALAEKLNELEIPTVRGGKWYAENVQRIMKRLEPGLSESFKNADQEKYDQFLREITPGIRKQ